MLPLTKTFTRLTCAVLLATAAVGCGSNGVDGSAPKVSQKQCRADWEDTRQGLGENGNPAQEGSVLAARYDELDAVATDLATTATSADCPQRLNDLKDKLDAFFDLEFEARQHDMLSQLAFAEGTLRHAIRTRDYDPLPAELAALFKTLRTQAPAAHAEMKAALDKVATAPLTRASVRTAKKDLDAAASQSPAYAKCQKALDKIGDYELDEE